MKSPHEIVLAADIGSLVIDLGRGRLVDAALDRDRLATWTDYLDRMIVDELVIHAHIRYLQKSLPGRQLPRRKLSQDLYGTFLRSGARGLPAADLVGVLLDPVTLASLHDLVDEEDPPFFAAGLAAVERQRMREHGLEPPPSPLRRAPVVVAEQQLALTRGPSGPPAAVSRRWQVTASNCQWSRQVGARPAGEVVVEGSWLARDGCLDIRVSGFLKPGQGAVLAIAVHQGEAVAHAQSKSLGLLSLALPVAPASGTMIQLRREVEGRWECSVVLTWD